MVKQLCNSFSAMKNNFKWIKNTLWLSITFIAISSALHAQLNLDTASFYTSIEKLDIDEKTIIAIGEAHNVKSTLPTQLFIINHLIEKGFRTLYIEGGQSEAIIINMYFETGNEALLQYTRARTSDSAYRKFLRSLYDINQKLSDKLTVKGFDIERPTCVGFLLSEWFKKATIGNIHMDSLSNYLLAKDNIPSTSVKEVFKKSEQLQQVFDTLKKEVAQHKAMYKKVLGTRYEAFTGIIYSPVMEKNQSRDASFTQYVLNDLNTNEVKNAIVIVGSNHLMYKYSFVPMLMNAAPEHYTINSFVFLYNNCKNLYAESFHTSRKKLLRHTTLPPTDKPLVKFSAHEASLVPAIEETTTILTELYNQW